MVKRNITYLFKMNPKHELVSFPWMLQKSFIHEMRKMDLGLQISLTESFNLVTADYITAGIPIVVSNEIDWVSDQCIAKTGNTMDIVTTIDHVIKNRVQILKENREKLSSFSNNAIKMWEGFVNA